MKQSTKRNTATFRVLLFDEIDHLRSDQGDPQRAQAVANLARQIMNTARIELEFVLEFVRIIGQENERGRPIALGNESRNDNK